MGKVKVLVSHPFCSADDLKRIQDVDLKVNGVWARYVEKGFRDRNLASDRGIPSLLDSSVPKKFEDQVGEAEVIFGLHLPANIVTMAPKLRWVQFYGWGVHHLANTGLLENGVTVTRILSVTDPSIAEFCLTLMLMHSKRVRGYLHSQQQHDWTSYRNAELLHKTLGIVGVGRIGRQVAQRAKGFEMRVLATRGSYRPGERISNVDEIYPPGRLREMLGQCDYVVVTVALLPQTRRLLGDPEFHAMKPGCFFINISRGAVVDERALIRALKDGRLGGAGLDVFEQEPLPPSSELWDMPNVFVLPHTTGASIEGPGRATEAFCENLRRYLDGQPLDLKVEPDKGYFEGYKVS